MNRYIFLGAFILAGYGDVSGQKFSFGPSVKAGISQVIYVRADTFVDHNLNNKYRFSWQLGAYGAYHFANSFSIGLEALYWQQQGKLEDSYSYNDPQTQTPTEQTDITRTNMSYIAMPVVFYYHLQGISLLAGGQPSYAFAQSGSKESTIVTGSSEETIPKEDFEPNLYEFDIGVKAGIHYRITEFLHLGIEYYNGRINLSQDNDDPYTSRNEFIYMSLNYSILRERKEQFYTD